MIFPNFSIRQKLLMIINTLVLILVFASCSFLYYYFSINAIISTFVNKTPNNVHLVRNDASSNHNIANANIRISSHRRSQELDRSTEETVDDTIYIDNDNYGDDNYDNSGNFGNQVGERPNEIPVTAPITIIGRPIEQNQPDDDFYYENYDDDSETDDEDIVSSGDGKIIVNVKKPLKNRNAPPEPAYIENVYSVSSEIVSNLKSQYGTENVKQINKPDRDDVASGYEKDDSIDDEWQVTNAKGRRLIGNNKKLVERSQQLLCESGRTGELCRMLFKSTAG
ncbi:CLUMA_CG000037, isoform A [Clunio marinus]|uniref:CLUMA_CG000037, isoform A n=1 Tax=Clunio marinus TaxID=568069 RepID=A0A1J1HIU3_9DIPT|nr:CLUMA_CG000037, isoform A [Clunio marinus]